MRPISILFLLLALAGAIISWLLLDAHHAPFATLPACGQMEPGGCGELSHSAHAVFLGLPWAAWGLWYFAFAALSSLCASLAGESWPRRVLALFLLLGPPALAVQFVLAVLMFRIGLPCGYCLSTDVLNLLMLLCCMFAWKRWRSERPELPARGFFLPVPHDTHSCPEDRSNTGNAAAADRRAVWTLLGVLFLLVGAAVFAASRMLQAQGDIWDEQRITRYWRSPAIHMDYPASDLTLGSAPDKNGQSDHPAKADIYIFTDPLCSACAFFHNTLEQYIRENGRELDVVLYEFPLDITCNPSRPKTTHPNACLATRAILAAGRLGVYREYQDRLLRSGFIRNGGFDRQAALDLAHGLADADAFAKAMDSQAVTQRLQRDIALAHEAGVKATPTLIINNRRIRGAITAEVLQRLLGGEE